MRKELEKALYEQGYHELRKVQEACLPLINDDQNIAVQAHTGSGKTLAYLLPSLDKVDEEADSTQVLIIAPTRELAMQISEVANNISVYTRIHIITLIGGLDIRKQANALRHRPHVIIATAGRLNDLLSQQALDLSHLKQLVIDEADQIISTGQSEDVLHVIKDLTCPIALFSATLNNETLRFMAKDYKQVIIDEKKLKQSISAYFIKCEDKESTLYSLLAHTKISSCVIFVNHKDSAAQLAKSLQARKILAAPFSSLYDERRRLKVIKELKEGKLRVIVATDAASRGLDINDVSHVIHYDLPSDKATFIHRSGRSGHQDNEGITITLLTPKDEESDIATSIIAQGQSMTIDKKIKNDLTSPILKEEGPSSDVSEILIRAGRKDKIRPTDVVGALTSIMAFDDIGKIEIQDNYTMVTIYQNDVAIRSLKIKGKMRKVERKRK